MIPNCCICGRFTTHYSVIRPETPGLPQDGVTEDWYCVEHVPAQAAPDEGGNGS